MDVDRLLNDCHTIVYYEIKAAHYCKKVMWFFKGHESHGSWYLAFVALLFGIFKAWKCDSWNLMWPSAQGYVTTVGPYWNFDALKMQFCRVRYLVSSKNLYSILATGKCDCSSGMTARPIGIRHRQSLFSVFWWSENEILQGSWNSWLGNIGFSLSIFSSFWRPEILQSRHLASCEPLLDILAT